MGMIETDVLLACMNPEDRHHDEAVDDITHKPHHDRAEVIQPRFNLEPFQRRLYRATSPSQRILDYL